MIGLATPQERRARGTYNKRHIARRHGPSRYRVKGVVWIEPEIILARSAAHAARDYIARYHHDLDVNSIVYVWTEEGWAVGDEPYWFSLQ